MRRHSSFLGNLLRLVVILSALFPAGAFAVTTNVTLVDRKFDLSDITIHVGDTVIWTVQDGTHTIAPEPGSGEPFCGSIYKYPGDKCTNTFSKVGTFPYYCQVHGIYGMTGIVRVVTAPNNSPPSVSLTKPSSGSTVSASPNNIFQATATDSDGTVQQVEFFYRPDAFANIQSLGVVTNQTNNTFTLLVTNVFPIAANLLAVAKARDDRGVETTSSSINFNSGPLLTAPTNLAGQFEFRLTATNGLTFIFQGSTNLTSWVSLVTNKVTTNGLVFSDPGAASNDFRFYRVLLQP